MKSHGLLHSVGINEVTNSLLEWQRDAVAIREEDICPNCDHPTIVSYQLSGDEFLSPHDGMENCGFYCGWCGWGNAGSRPKITD